MTREPNDWHEDEVDMYGPTLEDQERAADLEDILYDEENDDD